MQFVKVNIACALRWGVTSVGITLLGVTHPIWDNINFRCRKCAGGQFSSGAMRVKEADLWLCDYFCKMFGVN